MRVGRERVALLLDKELGFKVTTDSLFDGCAVFTNCASWAFDAPLRDFRWSYDLLLAFAA